MISAPAHPAGVAENRAERFGDRPEQRARQTPRPRVRILRQRDEGE
jgi:hypothetical protein